MLNIAYWAAGSVGMSYVYRPLLDFIEKLLFQHENIVSNVSENTAESMYGCRGFVAHGFLDSVSLNAGLLGESKWSLCVTCGAWLALSLWESILFSSPSLETNKSDQERILVIFRNIVEFFVDYLWEDEEGNVHSGPTTSPENSYILKHLRPEGFSDGPVQADQIHYLVFSPAIDISVMRQVSSVFNILVAICDSTVDDIALAKRYDSLVHRLPGYGLPLVSESGLIMEYPVRFLI
jgi:alpha-L-fucosidase 2